MKIVRYFTEGEFSTEDWDIELPFYAHMKGENEDTWVYLDEQKVVYIDRVMQCFETTVENVEEPIYFQNKLYMQHSCTREEYLEGVRLLYESILPL